MKKIILSILILFVGQLVIFGNKVSVNDPALIRINGKSISLSEFEAVYRKNNLDMQVVDPKTVDEYLELYVNFLLKVKEAESLGMDTNPDFLSELNVYRDQLARPYFNDDIVAENVVEEAYERMQYDIRASHILIRVDKDASPADTLEAYRKISNFRARALAGESFEDLARTYSEDLSAKDSPGEDGRPPRKGNAGDLGYFTVFNMVYPFESGAYNTALGDISRPVRSDFGYHIIKVTDKLPAMGTAKVAHIMVMTPADSSEEYSAQAKDKIYALYEKFMAGEDFEELAKQYSEDHNSAAMGGQMQPFTSSRMVPEFIGAIHKLESPAEVSKPVQSLFGWHIIKLIEKTPPDSYEDEHASLKTRISRDVRGQLSRKAAIERLKKEYRLREYPNNLKPFYSMVDESIFNASWEPAGTEKLNKRLLRFSSQEFSQKDFAGYLVEKQAHRSPQNITSYVNIMFRSFVEDKLMEYEDQKLESKYPEFGRLMKEYHDGILLFELTDQRIWSRALADTAGLQDFYKANRFNYMAGERLSATLFSFQDEESAVASIDLITEMARAGGSDEVITARLSEEHGMQVSMVHDMYAKESHPAVDEIIWSPGIRGPVKYDGRYLLARVHEVQPQQPKKMNEIRGLLIADYQQYLEEQWLKELRNKYSVHVDRDVLQQIQHLSVR